MLGCATAWVALAHETCPRVFLQASTQRTILCTWLTEIFLDEMTSLQDWDEDMEMQAQYAATLRAEFKSFLSDNLQSLNETTTFHLISSHGRVPELLYYAGLVKDYERVLTHYMQLGKWETALATLRDVRCCPCVPGCLALAPTPYSPHTYRWVTWGCSQAPEEHAEELYYKISPVRGWLCCHVYVLVESHTCCAPLHWSSTATHPERTQRHRPSVEEGAVPGPHQTHPSPRALLPAPGNTPRCSS